MTNLFSPSPFSIWKTASHVQRSFGNTDPIFFHIFCKKKETLVASQKFMTVTLLRRKVFMLILAGIS